jgi:farnesyl-diphosphate farnesyltransferase
LFVSHLGERSPSRLESELREHAEAFGIGLQLVNILKDVTDDFECNKSYIPRSLSAAQGLSLPDLFDPAHRRAAHAVVAPIFTRARAHLDRALTYTLAVPEKQDKLRLFCLLPLWMAVRTLMLARGNDDMFTPLRPVKISRQEVAQIIAECTRHARDDAVLRGRYARLWSEPHETFEAQRSVG